MKKERLEEIKEEYNFSVEQSLANRIPDSDIEWLIETVEEQQATIETLSMAHDNMARELSLFKEKDKHELIKSNIALNKKVQELENHIDHLYDNNVHLKGDYRLQEQNKRYRAALEEIITLEEYNNMPNFWHDEGDFYDYLENLARKALEGEE